MGSTKKKGDIGIGCVISDLSKNGIAVCVPISDHLPFDLIAVDRDMAVKRIQVKYAAKLKNGTIRLKLQSSWSNSSGCHTIKINKNSVDIFAVYCPESEKVYYIKPNEFDCQNSVIFRIDEPKTTKGKQPKVIRWANDFEGAKRVFKC